MAEVLLKKPYIIGTALFFQSLIAFALGYVFLYFVLSGNINDNIFSNLVIF